MTLTVSVATLGRPTLDATLQSITSQLWDGDECMVVGATSEIQETAESYGCRFVYSPPGHDWGASERNATMADAAGDYLAFLDDDDVWIPGARAAIGAAMEQHAGRPLIFRMQYAEHGLVLWTNPIACLGNVGTPMFVLPNVPGKLGHFGHEYGGDCTFLQSCGWGNDDYVWVPHIIARIRP